MSHISRWNRLRSDIEAATMRHEWAVAEVKRNGTTPALVALQKESRKECRELGVRFGNMKQPAIAAKIST
jgi:hypothetical protein